MILTDFDGTLVPIASAPGRARLDRAGRALLRWLRDQPRTRVGVISGRALPTLRALIRIPGLIYVGNHGLEMAGPGVRFVHPNAARSIPTVVRVAAQLRHALHDIPGAFIEQKRLSLSVHWRLVAPRDLARFRQRMRRVLAGWVASRAVRVTRGKRVIEIRPPVNWDKGRAVLWLMKRYGFAGSEVWYFGDDATDEDAFRAVNRAGGTTVFVGRDRRRTAAAERVLGIVQARALLRRLRQGVG